MAPPIQGMKLTRPGQFAASQLIPLMVGLLPFLLEARRAHQVELGRGS